MNSLKVSLASFSIFLLWQSLAFSLCVDHEEAKLRQGPGTNWPITWEVVRYFPLKKISKQTGWYRVQDVDGVNHWIRENLVTSKYTCATIKDAFAYLRTGPGKTFPKVPAEKGEKYLSFRIVTSKGDWVKVEDAEGDQAWVLKSLIWIQ